MTPEQINDAAKLLLDRAALLEMRETLRTSAGIVSVNLTLSAVDTVPQENLPIASHPVLSEGTTQALSSDMMVSLGRDVMHQIQQVETDLIGLGVDILLTIDTTAPQPGGLAAPADNEVAF